MEGEAPLDLGQETDWPAPGRLRTTGGWARRDLPYRAVGVRGADTMARIQGCRAAVAANHPLASQAGIAVLRRGGTAADAVIAVNAVLNVTQPDACGIGGDLFVLYYERQSGTIFVLNASGIAPREERRERLAALFPAIPPRSPFAVMVPGCIPGWAELHRRFGRLSWPELFQDAIVLADEGFPLSARVAALLQSRAQEGWNQDEAVREAFYGTEPAGGRRYRLPLLAETFRELAAEGGLPFFRGSFARKIVAHMRTLGAAFAEEDFLAYEVLWQEPLSGRFAGFEVCTTPPNSQGFTLLTLLQELEASEAGARAEDPLDPRYVRAFLEAKREAYRQRDAFLADPETMRERGHWPLPPDLGRGERATGAPPPVAGDTTAFSVVDPEGNAAVAIQSLYFGFGSGVVVPGTGVVLQNRGAMFSLAEGHPNAFRPGRRTAHTLMATMVRRPGGTRPYLLFSTMGADAQPQITAEVLSLVLRFGLPLEEALAFPRLIHGRFAQGVALGVEDRIPTQTAAHLAGLGEPMIRLAPFAYEAGHAQAIVWEEDGVLTAASDPRGDGVAAAY